MANIVPMSGGGGIQVVPQGRSGVVEQMALLRLLGDVAQTGIGAYQQHRAQSRQDAAAEAIAADLAGGQEPWRQIDPASGAMVGPNGAMSTGLIPGAAGAAGAAPGAARPPLPMVSAMGPAGPAGMDKQTLLAAMLMPGGREALTAAWMRQKGLAAPGEGFSLPAGGIRYDAAGRQVAAAPAAAKAPQTRDVLQGNERVFQELQPDGSWREVGRGPAFAPPAQTNVYNAPTGYRTTPEGTLEPIPGGPGERVEGPAAAGLALLPTAVAEAAVLSGLLFNEDGTVNRQAVATMNIPGVGGAVPGTAGAGYRAAMQAGAMAILRVESGGAVTEDEITNKLATYMPSALDTDDVAQQKFNRYQRDLQNALATISRGRGGAPQVPAMPPTAAAPGAVDQAISSATSAVQGMRVPSVAEASAMTAAQADRFVEGLDDAQLRALPADVRAMIQRKLEGGS